MQHMSQNQAEINITWLISEMMFHVHDYFSDFRPNFDVSPPQRRFPSHKRSAVAILPDFAVRAVTPLDSGIYGCRRPH